MNFKFWMSGPLMLMRIKCSKFTVINLLQRAVVIRFIVEKALSHSAVFIVALSWYSEGKFAALRIWSLLIPLSRQLYQYLVYPFSVIHHLSSDFGVITRRQEGSEWCQLLNMCKTLLELCYHTVLILLTLSLNSWFAWNKRSYKALPYLCNLLILGSKARS